MKLHLRWGALALIALFVGATYWIPNHLYRRLPRLEDEAAALWQARLYVTGRIALPSPAAAEAFGVPFIIDRASQRFSKYPPGHALFLTLGVLLGEPWIINPLLGALLLAVVYRFASELLGARWALLAVALAATSPMLLMLTASLMSHAASTLWATLCVWGTLKLRSSPRPTPLSALTGLALGLTFLTRPLTAACLFVAGTLLVIPSRPTLTRYGPLLLIFALTGALLPLYNFLLVGQFQLSLYTEWWAYDRLGFGPGVGPQGYGLGDALANLGLGLSALNHDLHGWLFLSLIPVGLGLALPPYRSIEWRLATVPLCLIAGYMLYFHSSRLYGPRYYVEGIVPLVFLSAWGIKKASLFLQRISRIGANAFARHFLLLVAKALPVGIAAALTAINLLSYLPLRFGLLEHLYGDQLNWDAVHAAQRAGRPHAIVFVFADNWPGAAAGMLTNSLELNDEVLFARYLGADFFSAVRAAYPDRALYFWRDGALAPATLPPPDWAPQCPTVCPPG